VCLGSEPRSGVALGFPFADQSSVLQLKRLEVPSCARRKDRRRRKVTSLMASDAWCFSEGQMGIV
jgi:hypothetical protein